MESDIVISGMSGRLPRADNVAEFCENLFNKVDAVTEEGKRWVPGAYGLPKRMGLLREIDKFDNMFFGVHPKQSHALDPQARILLEVTYESIADAGVNPDDLRGKNVGVFIGSSSGVNEMLMDSNDDLDKHDGYRLIGACQAMFANRISYAFDFKGPSLKVDTACSSGAMAFYQAYLALQRRDCEAAIVGACSMQVLPEYALGFHKLKMLAEDGKCKVFDVSGDGYVKSEAVVCIFLQRSEDARRKYASIVNVRSNTDGFKTEGLTYPSSVSQKNLISDVLKECKLNPREISYLEVHGTGTRAGDPVEISAVIDVFSSDREEPLLIGSVKSNIGHTEPASGICGIIKVLLAMEKDLVPPNLHFNKPMPEIKPYLDKQLKIVTETTPWNGLYAAVSSFGFGGANVHAVLKRNLISSKMVKENENVIPQLVLYCGRTQESVQTVFDSTTIKDAPREFFALLHKLAYTSPKMKPYRGYKVLGVEEHIESIEHLSNEKRPVWFVFSGMGTQWPTMAEKLMQVEVFAKSIRKSAETLKPYVKDFMGIVTGNLLNDTSVSSIKRSIIPSFVAITAIQIALVDVLTELGLKPDGVVGHSMGELGCAYADGCLTAEQTLLASYWRGKATEDSVLIQGAMAAVGLSWEETLSRCPKDVYPACHNSQRSVTVSGPRKSVEDFVDYLKANNIFAREVNTCGYAYHCDYVLPIAKKLQPPLEKLIPHPKQRSSRWISSSYPENKWNDPETRVAGAKYFLNNLVSPVLFCDALSHIPKNATLIEIGPHQSLRSILKGEVGRDTTHICLMEKNADNIVHLLSGIGKMYNAGLNPEIEKLYPPVTFPVPRNTPMISPLIKWDHSETWTVGKWRMDRAFNVQYLEFDPGPVTSSDHYLMGHCVDGRILFPATGYIVLVWKAFTKIKLAEHMNLVPIEFKNVKFVRATMLSETGKTEFTVLISKTTGAFEVAERGMTVCSGFVSSPTENGKKCISNELAIDKKSLLLNKKDFYKEMLLRGYEYGPAFKGVLATNISGTEAILHQNDNWVVLLDSFFQCTVSSMNTRDLYIPTGVKTLVIDPVEHRKLLGNAVEEYEGIPMKYNPETGEHFSAGIYANGLSASFLMRKLDKQVPLLEEYKFIPYAETCTFEKKEIDQLKEYNSACLSVLQKLLELSGQKINYVQELLNKITVNDITVNRYIKSCADDYVLLKCLLDILNNSSDHGLPRDLKKYFTNYMNEFENDVLCQILLDESNLRTVSDVVYENNISRKFKVVEITEGCRTLSSKINDFLPIPGMYNISYSVLHPRMDLLNKDHLPANLSVVSWDSNSSFQFKDVDLFILNYLKKSIADIKTVLQNAVACLKEEGFIIFLVKTSLVPAEEILSIIGEVSIPCMQENDLEPLFKHINLNIICKKSDSFTSTLYLLRRCSSSPIKDSVVHVPNGNYDRWVNELKEKMVQLQQSQVASSQRLWLVSENVSHSGIVGLVNCLRQEPGGDSIRCIFIRKKTPEVPEFSLTNSFYKKQIEKNLVMNVYEDGTWGSYRHIRCKEHQPVVTTEHAYLNILNIGDLSSFAWINSSNGNISQADNIIICDVYYGALNFRDVVIASGRVPLTAFSESVKNSPIGIEFSGCTSNGRRVMGIVCHKAIATTVVANPFLLFDVPDKWSLEEAATVPAVYLTAYYSLILRGKLQKGEKVLIHCGSGGVGQAAITLALSIGCDVYTTVGSEEKKTFLRKKFPQLQEGHISNSRDTSFEKDILNATNGKGVDVVLNSLSEEKLFASLNCLSFSGRFLEIGKYDLANNSNLGMAIFLKNISFHGIFLDAMFNNSINNVRTQLKLLVENGIAEGVVQPLNTTVFNFDEAELAFRYMASGRHIGKVLVKIREEKKKNNRIPFPIHMKAVARTEFDSKKSYVIIGGLGGMGLELCQWLIDRGAKHVVLSSRSGVVTGYQKLCLKRWKQQSANVVVTNLNAVKPEDAKDLLALANKLSPVGGIFNLALVLKDGFMENQTVQNYLDVCESKIESTKNMDLLTRELCPELDWFVCYSSFACGRGNPGQSNYGYANSAIERICEDRKSKGLPGLAIQWGAVGDTGFVAETGRLKIMKEVVSQKINSCLTVLDRFLQQHIPVVSSFIPFYPDRTTKVLDKSDIMSYVANIFGFKDTSLMNKEATLQELGMDSIIAVELKQVLEQNYDIVLSIPELRNIKVKDLKGLAGQNLIKDAVKEKDTNPFFKGVYFGKFNALTRKDFIPTDAIVHMNRITAGLPLFLVHPIQGSVVALQSLAELLQCPVYGIQCTLETPTDSVESMSKWYWKCIKSLNISLDCINLSGYSYGATIAFEMALQAEQDPKQHPAIKNLIFLDGSHNLITKQTQILSTRFDNTLENVEDYITFLFFFANMFPEKVNMNNNELRSLRSHEERIHYTAEKIAAKSSSFDVDDIKTAFHLFFSKIKTIIIYNPKFKINRDVHLIKASENFGLGKFLTDKYDLDKVNEGKINTYTVEGNHYSFLSSDSGKEVSKIMNKICSS